MYAFLLLGFLLINSINGLSYDEDIARRLVHFCGAVYCVDSEAFGHAYYDLEFNFVCDTCDYITDSSEIVSIYPFEDDNIFIDTEGLITYDSLNNAITIVFAGTDPTEIIDIITDIELIRVEYPGCGGTWFWEDDCTVHKGFYKAYLSVADKVYNQVTNLMNLYDSNPTIEITGHSLGGAMAVLCALDLAERGIAPTYVYTFGQPRVGDNEFVEYYDAVVGNDVTFRVTHGRDPVPLVPWTSWGWNYLHSVREVYYENDPDGSYVICDSTGEDPTCINQHNWWDVLLNIFVIDYHLNYLDVGFLNTVLYCNTGIDFNGAGGNIPGNYSDNDSTDSSSSSSKNISFASNMTYVESLNIILNWTDFEQGILYNAIEISNSFGLQTLISYSLREAAVLVRHDLGDDWDMNAEITNIENVYQGLNHTILITMKIQFENEKQLDGFFCDIDYIMEYFDIKFKAALDVNTTTTLIHDDSSLQQNTVDGCDCSKTEIEASNNNNDGVFGTTEILIIIGVLAVIVIGVLIVYVKHSSNNKAKSIKSGKDKELSSKDQFNWRVGSGSPMGSPVSVASGDLN